MTINDLQQFSGKAAVFIRGFIEALPPDDIIPLREAQTAGMKAVTDLNGTISLPYVSKVSRQLTDANVVTKKKHRGKWMVTNTDETKAFREWLEEDDYGLDLEKSISTEEVMARSQAIDHMEEHGGMIVAWSDRIPRGAFKLVMERFKEDEYDMVFVPHGSKVAYKSPEGEKGYAKALDA